MDSIMELSGVNSIVVELLNYTNYERWAHDMLILITGKGLTLIVEGTEPYPASPATTSGTFTTTGNASIPSTSSTTRPT